MIYGYRCPGCGPFDASHPLGHAPEQERCPDCAGAAHRVWTAPAVHAGRTALHGAIAAAEASAERPAVTQAESRRATAPTRPCDPRHALLPRP